MNNISIAIVDLSPICYAQFFGSVMKDDQLETDEDKILFFKHAVLNKIGDITSKLKVNETILALDDKSWRKKSFVYYKAKRAADRLKDSAKFEFINKCIDSLKQDIVNLNYKVIQVEDAEADDVIAILTKRLEKNENISTIYIVSGDKDFQQLTSSKVKLYSHLENAVINCNDKDLFIQKMILSGDSSDGIPNVLSDDDTFVNENKRQKACGDKKIMSILSEGLENILINDAAFRKNYERNQKLIILSEQFIPERVWNAVNEEYDKVSKDFKRKNAIVIGNYFRQIGLNGLVAKANNYI